MAATTARHAREILILALLGLPIFLSSQTFNATQNDNDAYVLLNWEIPGNACLIDGAEPDDVYEEGVYVQIRDVATQEEVYGELIDNLLDYATFITERNIQKVGEPVAGLQLQNPREIIGDWTVEFWIRRDPISSSGRHIFSGTDFSIRILQDGAIELSNPISLQTAPLVPLETWTHVAISNDATAGTSSIYINGTLEDMLPISGSLKLDEMMQYPGDYAELRVWDTARSAPQIAESYLPKLFNGANQDNLLIHYLPQLDDPSALVIDRATNYDGTADNANFGIYLGNIIASLEDVIFDADRIIALSQIDGDFRHYVGPDQNINYQFRLLQVGTGAPVLNGACTNLLTSGSTMSYQPPTAVVANDGVKPDSVQISWENNSKLSSLFFIYRDTSLIGTLNGTENTDTSFIFNDVYRFEDTTSLVNGETYNYCIRPYSDLLGEVLSNNCDDGNTFDIGLEASDDTFENIVELSWNDVSAFCEKINLTRNGEVFKTLSGSATSFPDPNPIYGFQSTYGVELLINNTRFVADFDLGSVPRNGAISGKTLTSEGDYAIGYAQVFISAEVDGAIFLDSTQTNSNGYLNLKTCIILLEVLSNYGHIKRGVLSRTPLKLL